MSAKTAQCTVDQIRSLAQEGLFAREIGERMGRTATSVKHLCQRNGIALRVPGKKSGARNPAWKGGRRLDKDGYVLVLCPGHPYANNNGYVREHRLVMERKLGRYLLPGEVVHHKGEKTDNDPDQLELYSSNGKHLAEELKGRVPNWTPEGKARMQQEWERKKVAQKGKAHPVSPEGAQRRLDALHRRKGEKRTRRASSSPNQ